MSETQIPFFPKYCVLMSLLRCDVLKVSYLLTSHWKGRDTSFISYEISSWGNLALSWYRRMDINICQTWVSSMATHSLSYYSGKGGLKTFQKGCISWWFIHLCLFLATYVVLVWPSVMVTGTTSGKQII